MAASGVAVGGAAIGSAVRPRPLLIGIERHDFGRLIEGEIAGLAGIDRNANPNRIVLHHLEQRRAGGDDCSPGATFSVRIMPACGDSIVIGVCWPISVGA